MSSTKTNRTKNSIPEPPRTPYENPPATDSGIILATMMDLKQGFGEIRADIQNLKKDVDGIKAGQEKTNSRLGAVESFQERLKLWAKFGSLVAAALGGFIGFAISNWDKIKAFLG